MTADLALINPMYQFSLSYFGRLFGSCIEGSEQSEDVPTRLGLLTSYTTDFVFKNVSRGLFEEHKGLFSFLLATSIARHPSCGAVSEVEWSFFLRGVPATDAATSGGAAAGQLQRPPPSWLPEGGWRAMAYLERALPAAFKGIGESVAAAETAAWQAW